ncbi:hypothetical protein HOLleu_36815 [Holothuria leucospilota]|uniref:Uncharacterized protein n=1 Tax=Holothuria leucospilota TaxID=206669 RepID=A0A9Q0YKD0_HOLLE|nr:hypothetical protein HOLleu_36815 [Holothuria leucospilota]
MKDHVKSVVRAASFAIYRIVKLRRYLDRKSVERLVYAVVLFRFGLHAMLCHMDYKIIRLRKFKEYKIQPLD